MCLVAMYRRTSLGCRARTDDETFTLESKKMSPGLKIMLRQKMKTKQKIT